MARRDSKVNPDTTDYRDCITVCISIPRELHLTLKRHCVDNNLTIKQVLHRVNLKGIRELMGGEEVCQQVE